MTQSKHLFTIREGEGSSSTRPDNMTAATKGKGSGETITHDPNWSPSVKTPQGVQPTPPAVVLGHELSHAVDITKGTVDLSINPTTAVPRAEEAAMRTENKIRQELKLPERSEYH